jgi:hypothetical protein
MAYLELLNGNKIRFGSWLPDSYLSMDDFGIIRTQDGSRYRISLSENDRYEIYTEPKRKVRYAPVIFKRPYPDELCRSTALFASEAEAIEWCKHPLVNGKFIQVDWDNAVEVEE